MCIGCGDGKITHYISQNLTNGSVQGIDISPEMIKKAKASNQGPQLHFVEGNITTFSNPDAYDVIHAGYSLHYVDAKKALEKIHANLKERGVALLTLPGKYEDSLVNHSYRLSQTEKWKPYFEGFTSTRVYYDKEEFSKLLEEAGLIPDQVNQITQKVEFESAKAIEDFYLPVSEYARHLPEELRRPFIQELIAATLQKNGADKLPIPFVSQSKLEVIAHKIALLKI